MLKIAIIATILVAVPFVLNAPEAKAQGMGGGVYSGTCPQGTCSKSGTERASDVRNCSAANCPKGPPLAKPPQYR